MSDRHAVARPRKRVRREAARHLTVVQIKRPVYIYK